MTKPGRWTHESVLRLAGDRDPVAVVTERARELVMRAMDAGWTGPPFDPLTLATQFLKMELVASDDVSDARTVPTSTGARIEFNPNRPRERRRYSVAHEIAHTLFPDCTERVRHRGSHHTDAKPQDWQLETLCNIAAAEILMPIGSLPAPNPAAFSIDMLTRVRPKYDVSMEAVLIRAAHIADFPCAVFAASRLESGMSLGRYRVDYAMGSHNWRPPAARGQLLPLDSVANQCTAIGFTAKDDESWISGEEAVRVECVGIPGFPGSAYPRVAGILIPAAVRAEEAHGITYLKGNVLEPRGTGPKVLVHVVNDATPNWGGRGVAVAIRNRWPQVQEDFCNWVAASRANLKLGRVRLFDIGSSLTIASVVAQHGYGESATPRIRYSAIESALRHVAQLAAERAATIHMPRIGTGYGGGVWFVIQEIITNTLCSSGLPVTVYDLPNAAPPSQTTLFETA
jgi:O-acetyl-ADP-ribose deacetylase (regulator of RNase III)